MQVARFFLESGDNFQVSKSLAPLRGRPVKNSGKQHKFWYKGGPPTKKNRSYWCSICHISFTAHRHSRCAVFLMTKITSIPSCITFHNGELQQIQYVTTLLSSITFSLHIPILVTTTFRKAVIVTTGLSSTFYVTTHFSTLSLQLFVTTLFKNVPTAFWHISQHLFGHCTLYHLSSLDASNL